MIPLPELLSELALGLGAALFGANALVLIRSRRSAPPRGGRTKPKALPKPPSMSKVLRNMVLGAAVALGGLAALLHR